MIVNFSCIVVCTTEIKKSIIFLFYAKLFYILLLLVQCFHTSLCSWQYLYCHFLFTVLNQKPLQEIHNDYNDTHFIPKGILLFFIILHISSKEIYYNLIQLRVSSHYIFLYFDLFVTIRSLLITFTSSASAIFLNITFFRT